MKQEIVYPCREYNILSHGAIDQGCITQNELWIPSCETDFRSDQKVAGFPHNSNADQDCSIHDLGMGKYMNVLSPSVVHIAFFCIVRVRAEGSSWEGSELDQDWFFLNPKMCGYIINEV